MTESLLQPVSFQVILAPLVDFRHKEYIIINCYQKYILWGIKVITDISNVENDN